VFGTISDCLKNKGYFELHKSSNKLDFISYMKNLEKQIVRKPGNEKPVLVLDNLAAHRSKEARVLMDNFCKVEFIPTYSCELNGPIETVWAILKRRVLPHWTKLLIRKDANKAKFKAIVRDELNQKIDK
jgi:transposase